MPVGMVTDNKYEVVSNRENDRHVWNQTIFPAGTDSWSYFTASMGDILSCFGEEVRGLLMDRYTEKFDEMVKNDEEGVPEPEVLTEEDAQTLAKRTSSDGKHAIERLRENGDRTRLSYEEALAEFMPLVGTTHTGCYLR